MTITKTCTGPCKESKPLDDFSRAAKGKYGRNSKCRKCWSDQIKALRSDGRYNEKSNIAHKEMNDRTAKVAVANRRRWTKAEDDLVREYWGEGFTAEDIAIEMGRSYQSIMWRVHSILNLEPKKIYRLEPADAQ